MMTTCPRPQHTDKNHTHRYTDRHTDRPPNDLSCVEWDVKPYTLTHSDTQTDRQTHTDRQTDRHTHTQTDRQDRQTG